MQSPATAPAHAGPPSEPAAPTSGRILRGYQPHSLPLQQGQGGPTRRVCGSGPRMPNNQPRDSWASWRWNHFTTLGQTRRTSNPTGAASSEDSEWEATSEILTNNEVVEWENTPGDIVAQNVADTETAATAAWTRFVRRARRLRRLRRIWAVLGGYLKDIKRRNGE